MKNNPTAFDGQAAALPETTQPTHAMNTQANPSTSPITPTKQAIPLGLWHELYTMKNIIALAAFASDARRTLEGIYEVRQWNPDIDKAISDRVTASHNWDLHEDVLSTVLTHVSNRLDSLLEADPEGA